MTNGVEPDTVASDKERHPMTLKLSLVLGKSQGLGLISIADFICLINIIQLLYRRGVTIDNYGIML